LCLVGAARIAAYTAKLRQDEEDNMKSTLTRPTQRPATCRRSVVKPALIGLAMILSTTATAIAAEGVVAIESRFPVSETIDRLEQLAAEKGLTVFLRVDHAAGAAKIGQSLRPTELLVFGNPKGGTPLMQCSQSAGIDLPLKALAWEDAAGKVWLGYNDPAHLSARHALGADCAAALQAMTTALGGLAQAAAQP
jgi:uncharacterized protein (DUF302 family)